jgi:hypothetical protein
MTGSVDELVGVEATAVMLVSPSEMGLSLNEGNSLDLSSDVVAEANSAHTAFPDSEDTDVSTEPVSEVEDIDLDILREQMHELFPLRQTNIGPNSEPHDVVMYDLQVDVDSFYATTNDLGRLGCALLFQPHAVLVVNNLLKRSKNNMTSRIEVKAPRAQPFRQCRNRRRISSPSLSRFSNVEIAQVETYVPNTSNAITFHIGIYVLAEDVASPYMSDKQLSVVNFVMNFARQDPDHACFQPEWDSRGWNEERDISLRNYKRRMHDLHPFESPIGEAAVVNAMKATRGKLNGVCGDQFLTNVCSAFSYLCEEALTEEELADLAERCEIHGYTGAGPLGDSGGTEFLDLRRTAMEMKSSVTFAAQAVGIKDSWIDLRTYFGKLNEEATIRDQIKLGMEDVFMKSKLLFDEEVFLSGDVMVFMDFGVRIYPQKEDTSFLLSGPKVAKFAEEALAAVYPTEAVNTIPPNESVVTDLELVLDGPPIHTAEGDVASQGSEGSVQQSEATMAEEDPEDMDSTFTNDNDSGSEYGFGFTEEEDEHYEVEEDLLVDELAPDELDWEFGDFFVEEEDHSVLEGDEEAVASSAALRHLIWHYGTRIVGNYHGGKIKVQKSLDADGNGILTGLLSRANNLIQNLQVYMPHLRKLEGKQNRTMARVHTLVAQIVLLLTPVICQDMEAANRKTAEISCRHLIGVLKDVVNRSIAESKGGGQRGNHVRIETFHQIECMPGRRDPKFPETATTIAEMIVAADSGAVSEYWCTVLTDFIGPLERVFVSQEGGRDFSTLTGEAKISLIYHAEALLRFLDLDRCTGRIMKNITNEAVPPSSPWQLPAELRTVLPDEMKEMSGLKFGVKSKAYNFDIPPPIEKHPTKNSYSMSRQVPGCFPPNYLSLMKGQVVAPIQYLQHLARVRQCLSQFNVIAKMEPGDDRVDARQKLIAYAADSIVIGGHVEPPAPLNTSPFSETNPAHFSMLDEEEVEALASQLCGIALMMYQCEWYLGLCRDRTPRSVLDHVHASPEVRAQMPDSILPSGPGMGLDVFPTTEADVPSFLAQNPSMLSIVRVGKSADTQEPSTIVTSCSKFVMQKSPPSSPVQIQWAETRFGQNEFPCFSVGGNSFWPE